MPPPLPVEAVPLVVAEVGSATNAAPVSIQTRDLHGLKNGDEIKIRDVTGNDAANGSFYVRVKDPKTVELFYDSALASAVAGTGQYKNGGTMLFPLPRGLRDHRRHQWL